MSFWVKREMLLKVKGNKFISGTVIFVLLQFTNIYKLCNWVPMNSVEDKDADGFTLTMMQRHKRKGKKLKSNLKLREIVFFFKILLASLWSVTAVVV